MARGSYIDLTGQTFNELTVIGRNPENGPRGEPRWDCECTCGGTTTVYGANLRYLRQKTCGCARVAWGKKVAQISLQARAARKQEALNDTNNNVKES